MDNTQKLDQLVSRTNSYLAEVKSVFPFELFPDTIRVDENKVDIISRQSFWDKHVLSLLIKDINTVTISSSVLFATLNFEVSGFVTGTGVKPYPIRYLWKKDAVKVRRIVLGLIAATKEGIDLAKIPKSELKTKIQKVGRSREFPQL